RGPQRGVPLEPRPDPGAGELRRLAADRVRRGRATLADGETPRGALAVRDLFDRRLTDPTAAEVIAATEAANAGHTPGNLTPAPPPATSRPWPAVRRSPPSACCANPRG